MKIIINTHTGTYIHIYTPICTYILKYSSAHIYTPTYSPPPLYTPTYSYNSYRHLHFIYTHIHIYILKYADTCVYINIYAHTDTYMYTDASIHTHTQLHTDINQLFFKLQINANEAISAYANTCATIRTNICMYTPIHSYRHPHAIIRNYILIHAHTYSY